MPPQKILLAQAVPANVQHLGGGVNGAVLGDGVERLGRDVFELEGDHIYVPGKATSGIDIVIRCGTSASAACPAGLFAHRLKNVNSVAHGPGGQSEHAPNCPPPTMPKVLPGRMGVIMLAVLLQSLHEVFPGQTRADYRSVFGNWPGLC